METTRRARQVPNLLSLSHCNICHVRIYAVLHRHNALLHTSMLLITSQLHHSQQNGLTFIVFMSTLVNYGTAHMQLYLHKIIINTSFLINTEQSLQPPNENSPAMFRTSFKVEFFAVPRLRFIIFATLILFDVYRYAFLICTTSVYALVALMAAPKAASVPHSKPGPPSQSQSLFGRNEVKYGQNFKALPDGVFSARVFGCLR